jgi:hypothetical protein
MCVLLHAGLSGIDDYAFGAATAASNSCSTSTAPCRNGLSRKKFRSANFIETGQLLWRGGEHNARKPKYAHCAACAHKRATTGTPW